MPSASPPPYEQYDTYQTPGPSAPAAAAPPNAAAVPAAGPTHVPGSGPASSSYIPPTGYAPPAPPAVPFTTLPHVPPTTYQNFHGHPVPVDPRRPAPSATHPRQAQSANQIDHLRNALSHIESRMALLLSERDLLESRLESAVRMQSPVQRLPSELLASIFVLGVMSTEEDDALVLATLMLVCRHWLEVAVNTPVLWTRIAAGVHHPLCHAQRKLERSKALPLHISVDFSPRSEGVGVTTERIVSTMDLLMTSIWRWKTFRLTVPNRPQAHAALMRCTEPAPLLELLFVRVLHSMQEEHFHVPPRLIFDGQTPSLMACSLESFNFGWDARLVSRLRVLKLSGYWNGSSPSIDVTLTILRACPLLEELVLRNMTDVDAGGACGPDTVPDDDAAGERVVRVGDARAINLPRLTRASFYYSGTLRTRTIFRLLSCPALESVELCFLDNVSPMIEYLRRQSLTCLPLRRLRIESCFFSELKLSRFLQRVPSLAELELVDVEDASSNLFRHLATPVSAQTWICPKLTTLSLEGCTTLEWESLRLFVESRLPAQSRAFPRTAPMATLPTPPSLPFSRTSSSASAAAAAAQASSSSSSQRPAATSTAVSSASAFAANAHILAHVPVAPKTASGAAAGSSTVWPQRLLSIDLTRCHQISKEMVQWLRLYVAEVRCDTAKGVWADASVM